MGPSSPNANQWPADRVATTAAAICSPETVSELLAAGANATPAQIGDILYEAEQCKGISLEQAAALLNITDPALRAKVTETARHVHERLFARRVRISDPVCPCNRCVNDCLYCPLRRSHTHLRRHMTGARDLQREVIPLIDEGHRHLTLVFGENRTGIQYVRDLVEAVYALRSRTGRVQRVDLNLNSSEPAELAALAEVERLGTYHVYQETYHPETYARVHPDGPKSDYAWRLTSHDRACEAGIRDLGLGVLLGLYDFRFDVLSLLFHAHYLLHTYHTGALVVSYPRLIPAPGAPASLDETWTVNDDDFTFLVAVTRLVLPPTELVLNTPAASEVRRELYAVGISQVAVGTSSYPGVYSADGAPEAAGRLNIGRPRNLEALVYRMSEVGFVPNFCVDCYILTRQKLSDDNRELERFPIHRTAANSLLALKEYLLDYASPDTQAMTGAIIQEELARLPKKIRTQTLELMEEAEAGFRGQML